MCSVPTSEDRYHFNPSVGTEELGHLEMIGTIVHQLTRNLTQEQLREGGFAPYFIDHTAHLHSNPDFVSTQMTH